MPVPSEDLRFAYRLLLDREPEDDHYKDAAQQMSSNRDIRKYILSSGEYVSRNADIALASIGVDSKIIYSQTKFGFVMPISFIEPLTFLAYVNDDYEPDETTFIYSSVHEGDFCIDLGARHGWFTGIMAARVGDTGRVYSFEPMPPAAGVRQLIEINRFPNIEIIAKGASNAPGTVEFDMQSLSANTTLSGPKRSIEVARLDDELRSREKRIRLIKADIEGAEYLAMQGAADILKTDRPLVVMELNGPQQAAVSGKTIAELVEFMRGFGYRCYSFSGQPYADEQIAAEMDGGRILNVVFKG